MPRLVPPVLPVGTLGGRAQPSLEADGGLSLRPWNAGDAATVATAYSDPGIQHWHHRSMTMDEAAEWIAEAAARWSRESDAEWAVVEGDDVVGRVALRDTDLLIGQAEVSYWTLPEARSAGVAWRAVARVAEWALEEIGFWRLEARHSTRNVASCRVAEAAGFRWEAQLTRAHIHDDGWHDIHVHARFQD